MLLIAIGSDHNGIDYKFLIKNFLIKKGYKIKDFGPFKNKKVVDYPDFIHPTSSFVDKGLAKFGIVLCGSGNGAAMTANKYKRIRAALTWNTKIAFLARKHNNANMISLPANFLKVNEVLEIVETFLKTKFEGNRHKKRIEKIPIKIIPQ